MLEVYGEKHKRERREKNKKESAEKLESSRREKQNIIVVKRSYEAAATNRLTNDWLTSGQTADEVLRWQLSKIRERSKDLWRNNDYAKSFGRKLKSNVIGSQGISLQNKAMFGKNFDTAANAKIEAAFKEQSKPKNFTVTRKQSREDFEAALIETIARDGEAIIKKVPGFDNEFKFAVQYIPADLLDLTLNTELSTGNNIVQGVEFNGWLEPVAYHFKKSNSKFVQRHDRVEARFIQHIFLADADLNQTRGVPWLHTAIIRLRNLGAYEEAAIMASRVGASGMGFIQMAEDSDSEYEGDTDTDGAFLDDVEPGSWKQLKKGQTPFTYNPAYPNINHGDFMKAVLRGASSGMGISYNSLSSDLEGVNFSSIRQGVLEDRDIYKILTRFLITHHNDDYYPEWLLNAIAFGPLDLPISNYDNFNKGSWTGRGFSWVDPLKDVNAKIKEVDRFFTSPQNVILEKGDDPETILDQHVAWNKMLKDRGLDNEEQETV